MSPSRCEPQRYSARRKLSLGQVDVQTDSENRERNAVPECFGLNEDSTKFRSSQNEVIRPLQLDVQARLAFESPPRCNCSQELQQWESRSRYSRSEQNREPEPTLPGVPPFSSPTSTPRLNVSDYNSPFGSCLFAKSTGRRVSRFYSSVVYDLQGSDRSF